MKQSRAAAREESITLENTRLMRILCGGHDENLRRVEDVTGAVISPRGNRLSIFGGREAVSHARRTIQNLYEMLEKGHHLAPEDILPAARLSEKEGESPADLAKNGIFIRGKKKVIAPKGAAQRDYLLAMEQHDLVFAIGPAGTGKTYLAMAMAVQNLQNKSANRIILTRPAVEAGEKLGFLPGDMVEKVNPYLRPLNDALHYMMDFDKAMNLLARGVIEVAPLAFMRGRTLNDSFIILDEAQNTTPAQMKMFLTRIGFNSKAVVTGDITQVDLPPEAPSGLVHARDILDNIDGINFSYFSERDVVRHPLVQEIIRAYERNDT